jgi:hypothetical protein
MSPLALAVSENELTWKSELGRCFGPNSSILAARTSQTTASPSPEINATMTIVIAGPSTHALAPITDIPRLIRYRGRGSAETIFQSRNLC